jgi:hypothetical protein
MVWSNKVVMSHEIARKQQDSTVTTCHNIRRKEDKNEEVKPYLCAVWSRFLYLKVRCIEHMYHSVAKIFTALHCALHLVTKPETIEYESVPVETSGHLDTKTWQRTTGEAAATPERRSEHE